MKVLLIGLFTLASGSALSMSGFELEISESSHALKASRNYEDIFVNDDDSVSILNPKFSSPTGKGSLSIHPSNLSGVCNLFGYGQAVSSSLVKKALCPSCIGNYTARSVVIDFNGKFESFDTSGYTKNKNVIKFLTCEKKDFYQGVVVSDRANFHSNDDGSTTIINPAFKINNTVYSLSSGNDLNSICTLFGYEEAISPSLLKKSLCPECIGNYTARSVVVDPSGKFESFDTSGYTKNKNVIKSLICN